MTERDKFNEWARFMTFDNSQALTAAWIAWQARAKLAEAELVSIAQAKADSELKKLQASQRIAAED